MLGVYRFPERLICSSVPGSIGQVTYCRIHAFWCLQNLCWLCFAFVQFYFIFCRNVMKIVHLMSFWVQNRTDGCKLLRMCLYAVSVLKPRKLCYAFMCVYILLCMCVSVCTWVCFILLGNSGRVVNSCDSFAWHCLSPLAAFKPILNWLLGECFVANLVGSIRRSYLVLNWANFSSRT